MADSANAPDFSSPKSGQGAGSDGAAAPPSRADARDAPRVVTTGGKIDLQDGGDAGTSAHGVDIETGERVQVLGLGDGRVTATRLLAVDPTALCDAALIDALAFSLVPPDDESVRWVTGQMRQFLPIEHLQDRKGCFGFKHSIRFGDGAGLIAWGGQSQRGRVYFSILGVGCATVEDWPALATWLRDHRAALKRVDVACDDFTGQLFNIEWAVEQYRNGGFNAGGRRPGHTTHGDWLDGNQAAHGRTLGIGSRGAGKLCRIYEKGKQLGDALDPWTRVEVEWRAKDRLIPLDILTSPGLYLAGAYPCLFGLSAEQSRIKTVAKSATLTVGAAEAWLKQQGGKTLNMLVQVYGGDLGLVVEKLRRDGMPDRVRGLVQAVANGLGLPVDDDQPPSQPA